MWMGSWYFNFWFPNIKHCGEVVKKEVKRNRSMRPWCGGEALDQFVRLV